MDIVIYGQFVYICDLILFSAFPKVTCKMFSIAKNILKLSTIVLSIFVSTPPTSSYASAWHKQFSDTCQGINLHKAKEFLKSGSYKPRQTMIVGIIDSGLDTLCSDVKPALWVNPKERPDGKDTDGNGYVDDIHGWNFLGTADGSFNMTSAGTEEYREFKRLFPKYKGVDSTAIADRKEYDYYMRMRKKAGIDSYLKFFIYNAVKDDAYSYIDSIVRARKPETIDTISINGVALAIEDDSIAGQAFQTIGVDMLRLGVGAPWKTALKAHRDNFELMRKRIDGIENDTDKRLLMGDNLKDESDIFYGNNILQAEGCDHGTFVAGVIAGQGVIDPNISGIFPEARLMILRAVPNGDEYDKDVSTAIRYAVDNGAKIINLSLGKMTSPDSTMVNHAIEYALEHDVLLIQAAGNSHLNIDSIPYYPTALRNDGSFYPNFIRVGASTQKGTISGMSNYGKRKVDLLAPGQDITSNTVDNKFMSSSGTSIAAPVTAAVAAMIRAYFPELKAEEVKDILVKSCRKSNILEKTCRSGGILDAAEAIRLAADKSLWTRVESMSGDSLQCHMKGQHFYPTWIEKTPCFYYNVNKGGKAKYYIANAATGKKTLLIKDMDDFVAKYAAITGDTLDPVSPALYGITFEPGNTKSFTLNKKGKHMRYDIARGTLKEFTPGTDKKPKAKGLNFGRDAHNPDSTYSMLGSGYDLFLRDNRSGAITRITHDGVEDAAHTYRCKKDTTTGNASGFWAGNRYIQFMQDNRGIGEMGIVRSLEKGRPVVDTFKMPMPGDSCIRRFRIYWYNPENGEGRYLPIDKYPDQNVEMNYHYTPEALFFTRKSRKGDKIDLCRVNVKDGTVDEIISESCEPHMNLTLFNYRIIDNGKEFIWWSERTGRGNYYLLDSDGKLKNRITSGETLVAGDIVRMDTVGRSIIFRGYGGEKDVDPYYPLYYKTSLDGRRQHLLTPGDYVHELNLSEDGKYAIDKYSRVDEAPAIRAFAVSNPERRHEIDKADITALEKGGWVKPRRIKVKAADGKTDLYGVMFVPSRLDTTKKYPIISNVYPGPQDDQITRDFAIDDNGNQSLAEMGFIVITFPSRGSSPLRGRDFYTYGYGNLRDYPLEDDKNTIEQLAVEYPFIDLDRVGIYGHSGGGFQTAAAMMTYPDFYKVGVSASGNHDNNIYIQWWGEAFHGLSEIPTNMQLAGNLKGKLLLITGDEDKNVPPSNTYRLADALIKKRKRFDMFVLPGKDHGVMCPYYQNLIRYYFKENLLSPRKEDIDIINHI